MYVSVNIIRHVFNRFSWRASVKTYSDLKYALGNLFLFLCLFSPLPHTHANTCIDLYKLYLPTRCQATLFLVTSVWYVYRQRFGGRGVVVPLGMPPGLVQKWAEVVSVSSSFRYEFFFYGFCSMYNQMNF